MSSKDDLFSLFITCYVFPLSLRSFLQSRLRVPHYRHPSSTHPWRGSSMCWIRGSLYRVSANKLSRTVTSSISINRTGTITVTPTMYWLEFGPYHSLFVVVTSSSFSLRNDNNRTVRVHEAWEHFYTYQDKTFYLYKGPKVMANFFFLWNSNVLLHID